MDHNLLNAFKEHVNKNNYSILAGPDWPDFEQFQLGENIPQFVIDELIEISSSSAYAEFYITNVCNLNCSDCRSFNNFDFGGHYDFDLELYQQWATKLDLQAYVILGGEPLLHPNLTAWIEGTRKLWPRAWAKLDSNGTYITKSKNLHQLLAHNEYFLCINMHNPDKIQQHLDDVEAAFGKCERITESDPRITYNGKFPKVRHLTSVDGDIWLLTDLNVPIHLRPAWRFEQSIAGFTNWNSLKNTNAQSVYTGDAKQSHDRCGSKSCHVMKEGKLYKCSTVATLPDFLKQKNLTWPDESSSQYQPISVDDFSLENYARLSAPIPLCAFCPNEQPVWISANDIKTKIKNLN